MGFAQKTAKRLENYTVNNKIGQNMPAIFTSLKVVHRVE